MSFWVSDWYVVTAIREWWRHEVSLHRSEGFSRRKGGECDVCVMYVWRMYDAVAKQGVTC